MNKLHPSAFWLFFFQSVAAWFFACVFFVFIFGSILIPAWMDTGLTGDGLQIFNIGLGFFGMIIALASGINLIWAKLYYETYKYSFEKEGVKIERGVIWKKYVTIPYGRIQNVDILRGPLARILGLSDLQIQTAGVSGIAITEGRIPGILREEAEKHRTELISKLSGSKEGL